MALVGVMTVMLGHEITIPLLNTRIYMEEGRLYAGQHPNGSAMLFLMAMIFTIYLMARYPRKWLLITGSLMLLCQYAGVAFTVSRTVMVEIALAAGILAFLAVMRIPRAVPARCPHAARIAAAVVLALVCCILCYAGFAGCVEWSQSLSSQAETADAVQNTVAQRPLLDDLYTLTGRTSIYQNVLKYVQMHPDILATGLIERDIVTNIQRELDPNFWLAHNGWLQTLLTVGLPGLLFALYFTFLTAKLAVKNLLLRCQSGTLADKILILLPVLLVLNCLTECVLFVEQFSVGNFAYLICLGYVLEDEYAEGRTETCASR